MYLRLQRDSNQRCSFVSLFMRFNSATSSSLTHRFMHSMRKAGTDSHGGNLLNGIFGLTFFSNL